MSKATDQQCRLITFKHDTLKGISVTRSRTATNHMSRSDSSAAGTQEMETRISIIGRGGTFELTGDGAEADAQALSELLHEAAIHSCET